MKRLKIFGISTILLIALLNSPQLSSADDAWIGDSGESWAIPDDGERGMHVQQFIDSRPGESISYLVDWSKRSDIQVDPTCKSVTDERCVNANLGYSAILPLCGELSSVYCVEEFGVIDDTGARTPATFSRYFPRKALNEFPADESRKLPFGGTGSLFELPQAAHGGGNTYYLSVLTEGEVRSGETASLNGFSIRLNPVRLKSGDRAIQQSDSGWRQITDTGAGNQVGDWVQAGFGFSGKSFCVAGSATEGLCAQRYAFPSGKKFYVKVRMQNQPAGWMHGRIYQPEISIQNSGNYFTFDISANPVAVPVVYKMYRYPEMPTALKEQYDVRTGQYKPRLQGISEEMIQSMIAGGCGRSKCSEDPLTRNIIDSPSPSDRLGMDQLKLWLPFVEDQATALLGTWSMRTLEGYEVQGSSRCFADGAQGVTGIVTTNATQYSGGPPAFNKDEGTLEYRVAAPHYTPKKAEFLGSYDLLMRSDVARCIYGFTNAPIKASLSIVNNGENQRVATENLGERNGWVFLSAAGFTYSDPTIKVKLTQDPPPTPTPTPTPTNAATSSSNSNGSSASSASSKAKKKTIICVSGGKSKKVSGVKPKCPPGFKKR
jgi:hypothetical protein